MTLSATLKSIAHIQGIRDVDGNGNGGLAKDCIDGLDQRGLEMGF